MKWQLADEAHILEFELLLVVFLFVRIGQSTTRQGMYECRGDRQKFRFILPLSFSCVMHNIY